MPEYDPVRRPDPPLALRTARDLPHSLESEQAVLGAILSDDTAFDQVAGTLQPRDFYRLEHQHVYEACVELAKEAKTLDAVMVQQRLDAKGLLGGAVPRELPFVLQRAVGLTANVAHYARGVKELSSLRNMMLVAQGLVERGYEAGTSVQGFLEAAQQEVFSAAQRVVLAARPSVGKTAFALNIATHAAAKAGKKVAFFSLEMPSEQLALRMLASEAKLDWRRLSQGMLSTYDWTKIAAQGDRLSAASLWLDDNFVLTPVELRSKCRKLRRENGALDLVLVDYLQLMHAPSDRSNQSREQEIATISRSLKSLAKELECPVVALSQLNRGVEKRKGEPPMLSDLRESGAIEQDADIVMFLHRNEEDSKDQQGGAAVGDTLEVDLIVAKQRQGPTCTIPLVFFRPTTFFAEMERRRDGGQ